jgi:hypothetical protein
MRFHLFCNLIRTTALLLLFAAHSHAAGDFSVSVASVDITPEPGAELWGYGDRNKAPGTGKLDPLHAKTLFVRVGDKNVAIVTLDLGRVPPKPVLDRIRSKVAESGVSNVFFTASHTHSAPSMEDEESEWIPGIEKGIQESILAAASNPQPARIGVGTVEFDIAHNRRKVLPDGTIEMMWRNAERVPTSPLDKEATLVKITDEEDKPIAVLVHYACHPVILGPTNLEYSADYPGEMMRLVEEKTGAACLFLQGGCGDINPYLDKFQLDEGGIEAMRGEGKKCADAVLSVLPSIETKAPENPSIDLVESTHKVGLRSELPSVINYMRRIKGLSPDLEVPLSVLVLNKNLALVGMPGEVFVDFQLELKKTAALDHTLLVGYTNEYHAYFPTVRAAAQGAYGGAEATYVGVGAGDKLVTAAQLDIARSTGIFAE